MRKQSVIRRRRSSRRLVLESLESRRVLDASIDVGPGEVPEDLVAEVPDDLLMATSVPPAAEFSRFESAEELEQFLLQDALSRYADLFGQKTWNHWYPPFYRGEYLDAIPVQVAADNVRTDASGTNNQVVGVEEGDLVETDGEYLYVLRGQQLAIVDVRSAAEMAIVSVTETSGSPLGMYLSGDRVTIVSQDWNVGPMPMLADALWARPAWGENSFHVTVLDVTDPAAPQVAGDIEIDGSYVQSRMIDGFVYVVSQSEYGLPAPEAHPVPGSNESDGSDGANVDPIVVEASPDGSDVAWLGGRLAMPIWFGDGGEQYVYETQEEYLARVEGQILELALPGYSKPNSWPCPAIRLGVSTASWRAVGY